MGISLVQRIYNASLTYPQNSALLVKDENDNYQPQTYSQLMHNVIKTAHFLQYKCGIKKAEHIGLICDNRPEWIILDLAMQSLEAVDVPRGSDTAIEETAFILEHSNSTGCVFETFGIFEKVASKKPELLKKLRFIIFVESDIPKKHKQYPKSVFTFQDIVAYEIGESAQEEMIQTIKNTDSNSLATIIYTSGTTSQPKGVCLTQQAFEVQIDNIIPDYFNIKPGHVLLSILPVWHVYAREISYIMLGIGATIAYSQPIGTILLKDIITSKTNFMTSVPRIWEGVYNSIRKKVSNASVIRRAIFALALGVGKLHCYFKHMLVGTFPTYKKRSKILDFMLAIIPYVVLIPFRLLFDALVFKKIRALLGKSFIAGISGGGALPRHVDLFFEAAGILILEGYGLTETAPVLSVKKQYAPEKDSVGKIFPAIQYKIIDKQGNMCSPGEPGVLYVKTVQVMQGYYHNEAATNAVLQDGWLNTGDLVMESHDGNIKILGREKDTIVLLSGENVEPEYLENLLTRSNLIEHAFVIGQDEKYVSALLVPNKEELLALAEQKNITLPIDDWNTSSVTLALAEQKNITLPYEELCKSEEIKALFRLEIQSITENLNSFERINKFVLLSEPFTVGKEFTQTLKIKRSYINKKYKNIIDSLYQ